MARDLYPVRFEDRPEWHTNFALQAAATGTNYSLTAAEVTQIGNDADAVRKAVNYARLVDTFAQAVTEHRRLLLEGPVGSPLPAEPIPPAPLGLGGGAMAAVAARIREYARRIKASAGYSESVGESYGIVLPAARLKKRPEILGAIPLPGGRVELRIKMNGYRLVAVDMRRGGDAFEEIGVSQRRKYVDTKPILAADGTETREYRLQGMEGNRRVGEVSGVATAVTQE